MKERLEYLFLQYLESSASEAELEEFLSYVKEARHDHRLRDLIRAVYSDIRESDPGLVSYIDETGSLFLNELTELPLQDEFRVIPGRKRNKMQRARWVALSCIFILVAAGAWWLLQNSHEHKQNAVAVRSMTRKFTERTEYKLLVLPDSTEVWLNSNSSLEFPDEFSEKKREVYLTGEAYFDVRHAEESPFVIHTGRISTTVLGTALNIKAYPYQSEVMVSVSKGKVRVDREDLPIAVLQKGQQIRVGNRDTVTHQKMVDTASVNYWQEKGAMVYDDERIADIVKNLEETYNVSIKVADSSLLDTRMTTSFNRGIGIEQALQLISKPLEKEVVVSNGKYTIE